MNTYDAKVLAIIAMLVAALALTCGLLNYSFVKEIDALREKENGTRELFLAQKDSLTNRVDSLSRLLERDREVIRIAIRLLDRRELAQIASQIADIDEVASVGLKSSMLAIEHVGAALSDAAPEDVNAELVQRATGTVELLTDLLAIDREALLGALEKSDELKGDLARQRNQAFEDRLGTNLQGARSIPTPDAVSNSPTRSEEDNGFVTEDDCSLLRVQYDNLDSLLLRIQGIVGGEIEVEKGWLQSENAAQLAEIRGLLLGLGWQE